MTSEVGNFQKWKTKLMTNSSDGIQRDTMVKRQKLGTITNIKYLGTVVSDDG